MKKITFLQLITLLTVFFSCNKDKSISEPEQEPMQELSFIECSESLCGYFEFVTDTFYFHKYETDPSGYQLLSVNCKLNGEYQNLQWSNAISTQIITDNDGATLIFHSDSVEESETISSKIILNYTDSEQNIKTIEKYIYLKKFPVPWLGTFTGYNTDNPSDTFTIEFTRTDDYGGGPACCISYVVKNLPEGINQYVQMPNQQGAYFFTFNNECDSSFEYTEIIGYNFSGPKGTGYYENGNVIIDYYYKTPMPDTGNSIIVRKKFVGIKN